MQNVNMVIYLHFLEKCGQLTQEISIRVNAHFKKIIFCIMGTDCIFLLLSFLLCGNFILHVC